MSRAELIAAYRSAEANCNLEGMDPSGDAVYEAAKARVLAGEMTPEEGLQWLVEQSRLDARRLERALAGSAA